MKLCNKEVNQLMINSAIFILMIGFSLLFQKNENYVFFSLSILILLFLIVRFFILAEKYINCTKK